MTTSMDALISAIDALKEQGPAPEWPQVATQERPVATSKCLRDQGSGHAGHTGHSQTIQHGHDPNHARCSASVAEHGRVDPPPNLYPLHVATVATVATAVDCEAKISGHIPDSRGHSVATAGLSADLGSSGFPSWWLDGVARLAAMAPPRNYPEQAWQQLIVDTERFLDGWAVQAAALNWPAWELFGCHRRAPWGRIQGMGLVLLLRGKELAAMTDSEAVIRTPSGAHQTYRRQVADPLHPAERCLVWELSHS